LTSSSSSSLLSKGSSSSSPHGTSYPHLLFTESSYSHLLFTETDEVLLNCKELAHEMAESIRQEDVLQREVGEM